MSGFRERMSGDGEVFEPTADGYLRWRRTTRPRPSRREVLRAGRDLAGAERRRLLLGLLRPIGHRDRG